MLGALFWGLLRSSEACWTMSSAFRRQCGEGRADSGSRSVCFDKSRRDDWTVQERRSQLQRVRDFPGERHDFLNARRLVEVRKGILHVEGSPTSKPLRCVGAWI